MIERYSRRNFCTSSAALGVAAWNSSGVAKALLAGAAAEQRTYTNPVLAGNHPDASPIRVGSDYYITHSSFVYAPGLIVWHSRDLVHWAPVTSALPEYIGNVWAPYLCEHQGHFYIYFPVDGNLFVVHAASPAGPWSKPISLHIRGIDPAHLSAPDGRRLLYFAGGQMVQLSPDGLSVTGSPRKVFEAWPIPEHWRVQCECLEAPKLTLRNGYIYLTFAEGGTNGPPTSHMVVSMRSRNPEGPWEFSPYNPILHTTSKDQYWWSVGHGRLVDATDGSWWMTCHAYENGYRSLGRQTLLVPVQWTPDGWYRVDADISHNAPIPAPPAPADPPPQPHTADFNGSSLGLEWQFWKAYDPARFSLRDNTLTLAANGTTPADTSVLTCMALDRAYTIEVDIEISDGCSAGLLLYYSGEHSVGFQLLSKALTFLRNGSNRNLGSQPNRLTLRIVNDEQEVDSYFRLPGQAWQHVRLAAEVVSFNDNVLGGFLDLRPALFACGSGHATFREFKYLPGAHDPTA